MFVEIDEEWRKVIQRSPTPLELMVPSNTSSCRLLGCLREEKMEC